MTLRFQSTCFVGAVALAAAACAAQVTAYKVADINPNGSGIIPNSRMAAVGDTVFFWGNDGHSGTELWTSDGTAAGTVMHEIRRGSFGSGPFPLVAAGGEVYFQASNRENRWALFASDGTARGTREVSNLAGGNRDANPRWITPYAGGIAFSGLTPRAGNELYVSDGSKRGTSLVADLAPGELSSAPAYLAAAGSTLYFTAQADAAIGRELYKYDGTAVSLVHDLRSSGDSFIQNVTAVGDRVFFTANNPIYGLELHVSDGTSAGTRLVDGHEPRPLRPNHGLAHGLRRTSLLLRAGQRGQRHLSD